MSDCQLSGFREMDAKKGRGRQEDKPESRMPRGPSALRIYSLARSRQLRLCQANSGASDNNDAENGGAPSREVELVIMLYVT